MEIRQLKYFIAVADSLSFTRASELLYVSQPALSKQISDLENELGVALLERTKRSVLLTSAGVTFLQKAKELLNHMDSIVAITKASKSPAESEMYLNIGIERSALYSPELLTGLQESVFSLRQRLPFIRVHFCTIPEDESNARLSPQPSSGNNSTPDVCLCKFGNEINTEFGFHCLLHHPLVIQICSEDYIEDSHAALESLLSSRTLYIDQTAPALLHQTIHLFEQMALSPRIILLESPELRNMIVGSGDGMMVVSEAYGGLNSSSTVRIIHPDVPNKWLHTGLLWRLDNMNPAIQLLIQAFNQRETESSGDKGNPN